MLLRTPRGLLRAENPSSLERRSFLSQLHQGNYLNAFKYSHPSELQIPRVGCIFQVHYPRTVVAQGKLVVLE